MSLSAISGLDAVQSRVAELTALTGQRRMSFEAVLDSAVRSARGPLVWDGVAQGTTSTTGTGTTGTGATGATGAATGSASTAGIWPSNLLTGSTTGSWADALPEAGRPWAGAIQEAADRNGVDPALLASLVWAESGFRPDAVSSAGATGLTQLMPATARSLGVDATDPLQNLDGGARFLRSMLDRYGRIDLALAAYNAGPGRVDQAGGVPNIPETQRYVERIRGFYTTLLAAGPAPAPVTPAPAPTDTVPVDSVPAPVDPAPVDPAPVDPAPAGTTPTTPVSDADTVTGVDIPSSTTPTASDTSGASA